MAKQRKPKLDAGAGVGAAGPEIRLNAGFSLVLNAAPNGVVPLRIGKLTFPLTREDAISMLFGDDPEPELFAAVLRPPRRVIRFKRGSKRRSKRKPTGKVKLAAVKSTSIGYAESRKRYRQFADAYLAGASVTTIAKRYGVAMQTVYYGLLQLKVPKRRRVPKSAKAAARVAAS